MRDGWKTDSLYNEKGNIMRNMEEKVLQAMLCMTRQCWEQGIAAQALMECGHEELYKLAVYDMVLRQSSDGRLCNVENTPAVTDSAFCIPAVLEAGRKYCCGEYKTAAEKNIRFLLEDAEHALDHTLFHMIHTQEIWADSAAFLPYSLALAGHWREAWTQMEGICSRLYHKESGLYYHMWDEGRKEYLRPLAWGVGNGWILTGLLRTLLVWNEGFREEKIRMEARFHELLDNMLAMETKEHGFHDILDDDSTFQESETAAMVAYAIYRGVSEGMVDTHYLERADRIREALLEKVTSQGLVQDAASSPGFDRPGTSVECQAHVLMMEKCYKNVRNS